MKFPDSWAIKEWLKRNGGWLALCVVLVFYVQGKYQEYSLFLASPDPVVGCTAEHEWDSILDSLGGEFCHNAWRNYQVCRDSIFVLNEAVINLSTFDLWIRYNTTIDSLKQHIEWIAWLEYEAKQPDKYMPPDWIGYVKPNRLVNPCAGIIAAVDSLFDGTASHVWCDFKFKDGKPVRHLSAELWQHLKQRSR